MGSILWLLGNSNLNWISECCWLFVISWQLAVDSKLQTVN